MISFAARLKKQNPSMSYGHGWIIGADGKLFHPSRSQSDLLQALTTRKKVNTWQSKVKTLCNLVRANVSGH
ncbi:phage filamentation protein Fil family protein [Rosenbergiella epipactidis]|uniref:phage filamentation protein Fil family protein n=1 Tax=Rosenbergiella epipactidis TaxID=1544694 RepID=UPI001F4D870F|nr:phage filamentation protein Fil family protein [Rosenbergiella epipactidis]